MSHFLQSPAWKAFQESLGRSVVANRGEGWEYQATLESGAGNTRLYCPYGPTVSSLEAFDAAINSLRDEAMTRHATFVRIEPIGPLSASDLRKRGFKPVTYQQLQPAHTLVIDLTSSKDDILAAMSQNSRNLTRNYMSKGITIHTSYDPDDIAILTSLLSGVAARNGITTHGADYFQKQAAALFPTKSAVLYYATYESTPIAAALVYDDATTRYYAHAAADDAYRKLSAGTALVGQMILDAKDNGLTKFDLYGVAPTDDPHHPWAGFTKFKRSFGGEPVTYLGAWDLPLKHLPYSLYRLYQSLRRHLR
jgi:lipid II:glycine glycyltransferase (peptidoglycan interpeptide bridge formation enzyme)